MPAPIRSSISCRVAAAALALASVAGPAAAGTVEVRWLQPERYADAGRTALDRERTLASLAEHVAKLGAKLPDGQTLTLEVLDLDLAGEIRPRGWNEVRVLRGGTDAPRISLRYALQGGGMAPRSGEVRLADLSYLDAFLHAARRGDELVYEKRMLDRWFDANFGAH